MKRECKDHINPKEMMNKLGLNKRNSFLYRVSGTMLRRYTTGVMIGICFEYAYRVETDYWHYPLGIGIVLSISALIDVFYSYR